MEVNVGRKRRVAVCGHFDPFHIGHLRHLEQAKELGDWLIVIVSTDKHCLLKKGFVFMPEKERLELMLALKCVNEVVLSIDEDGTVAKTIKMLKPDILAKGGDRTPDNMPQNEIDACKEVGCELVYGVGEQLNTSRGLLKRLLEHITNLIGN